MHNIVADALAPFAAIRQSPIVMLSPLVANIILYVAISELKARRRAFRVKKEHGSAALSKLKDFSGLKHAERSNNILLSANIALSIDHHSTGINLNAFVVGGPGSGKTRGFIKPNILNLADSRRGYGANMVITDPKSNILSSVGKYLKKRGYTIKVINLSDIAKSDYYNPFSYMRIEKDEDRAQIISLIDVIIKSTNSTADGKSGSTGDAFWTNSEKMLLQALFFYVLEAEPPERRSLVTIISMLDETTIGQETESKMQAKFRELAARRPDSLAVSFWKQVSASNVETMRSTLAMANARFSLFKSVQSLFSKDSLELEKLDNRKTAIFVTTSPANSSLNFIATMFYTQLFQQVDYIATQFNAVGAGAIEPSLKIPLLLMLDEFANLPKIPNFLEMLAYARSLNMGIIPIFQSTVQAQHMYEKDWETIVDACDTFLYLGGAKSNFTTEYVAKFLGKETIDMHTYSNSYDKGKRISQNVQVLARDLMTADEVGRLPKKDSILRVGSINPIITPKYNLTSHPKYKFLADANAADPSAVYIHDVPERNIKEVYVVNFSLDDASGENHAHDKDEEMVEGLDSYMAAASYNANDWQ